MDEEYKRIAAQRYLEARRRAAEAVQQSRTAAASSSSSSSGSLTPKEKQQPPSSNAPAPVSAPAPRRPSAPALRPASSSSAASSSSSAPAPSVDADRELAMKLQEEFYRQASLNTPSPPQRPIETPSPDFSPFLPVSTPPSMRQQQQQQQPGMPSAEWSFSDQSDNGSGQGTHTTRTMRQGPDGTVVWETTTTSSSSQQRGSRGGRGRGRSSQSGSGWSAITSMFGASPPSDEDDMMMVDDSELARPQLPEWASGLDAPGQRMLLNIMSRDGRGVLPRMMFPDMMMGQGGDDIDNMSYEQLLELSQSIGDAKPRGASATTISSLPTSKFHVRHSSKESKSPSSTSSSSSSTSTSTSSSSSSFPAAAPAPKHKEDSNEAPRCIVCLCDFDEGDEVTTLPCFHVFHTPCINEWLRRNGVCPICKFKVPQ